jgi:hypothetical protein
VSRAAGRPGGHGADAAGGVWRGLGGGDDAQLAPCTPTCLHASLARHPGLAPPLPLLSLSLSFLPGFGALSFSSPLPVGLSLPPFGFLLGLFLAFSFGCLALPCSFPSRALCLCACLYSVLLTSKTLVQMLIHQVRVRLCVR